VKKFENFLKEDPNKPIKQFGDNVTSSARVQATGDIIKSGKAKASQKKIAKDVLGNLNRFFSDKPDSETLKTKPTGDEKTFKTDKTKTSKPTPSVKSKPVEPLAKRMARAVERGIKSGEIPQDALVRKPNKPKPKPASQTKNVVKPDKFKDVVKKFQGSNKNIENIKKIPASEVKPVVPKKDPSFKISGTTSKTTPPSKPTFTKTDNPSFKDFGKKVNNVKSKKPISFDITTNKGNVVTQSKSSAVPSRGIKTDFLDLVNKPKTNPVSKFIRKGLEVQGIVDPKPNTKAFTRTKDTITTNFGKAVKPSKLGRFVRGVSGRLIAPAFAVKDYLDTTAKTQAQGYSKNYSRAKGLTKALSGYIGGGIGATVGGAVGLGIPGSIAGGVTGYHYGQKLGDKAFDYGQKVVSGKKTFKDIRKDINKGIRKLDFRNKQY
jgi:hypothetical protein